MKSREALTACVVDNGQFAKLDNYGYEVIFSLLVFFEADDGILHARMFAPLSGIPEFGDRQCRDRAWGVAGRTGPGQQWEIRLHHPSG